MRPIHVRIVLIRRGLIRTSLRGGFVRAYLEIPNNSSYSFNVWTFLKVDLEQAAPLPGLGKSSYDCSGRDRRS